MEAGSRSVRRLPVDDTVTLSLSSLRSNMWKSTSGQTSDCLTISEMFVQTLTTDKNKELDLKFSKAVHVTAITVSIFWSWALDRFFVALRVEFTFS